MRNEGGGGKAGKIMGQIGMELTTPDTGTGAALGQA
jgi:hypothetical protein